MIRTILILVALIGFSVNSLGQARYNFLYEAGPGSQFGAENITSIHYLWKSLDDRLVPTNPFDSSFTKNKNGNRLFRFGKLFLIDYPITFILPSIQHERFGYGSRVKEFGGEIGQVRITLPPPFQVELPSISFSENNFTAQQRIVTDAAGSEANTILANVLRRNMLLEEQLDYRSSFLYLYANNDLSGYTLFAASEGSDISSYVNNINAFYGLEALKLSKIQTYSLFSIITDPINAAAFYGIFKGYIWDGRRAVKAPLINLTENLKLLPKFKFNLAPYGPELTFKNYFKRRNGLYSIELTHSDGTFPGITAWRIGLEGWNLMTTNTWSFNFFVQVWNQPSIEYRDDGNLKNKEGNGAGIAFSAFKDVITMKENKLGLMLRVGYKSAGFVPGEKLESGMILQAGVSLQVSQ
ncbi:MAG: hypothetical protein HEP71_22300 [Roseivirga sp.]|nr:hypothetical protein [Roseivirga sp.]